MRVLHLTESGYENGLVRGRIEAKQYRLRVTRDRSALETWLKPEHRPLLSPQVAGWHQEDFQRYAMERHKEGVNTPVDYGRYPELRGMAQYWDDEVRGLAEGAGISYEEMVFRYEFRCVSNYAHTLEPGGCTTIIFQNQELGPIIGRNSDSGLAGPEELAYWAEPLLLRQPPGRGYSYLENAYLNEKGLFFMGSSIAYPKELESAVKFPMGGQSFDDLVLRHCATTEEAVEMVSRYAAFGDSANFAIADAQGGAAVVEKSKRTSAVRWARDGVVFTTDGIAVEDETGRLLDLNDERYQFALTRHRRLEELTEAAKPNLTVEAMWRILRDHYPPSPLCKHLDRMPPFYPLATLLSHINLPRQQRWMMSIIDLDPIEYPCQLPPQEHWWRFQEG